MSSSNRSRKSIAVIGAGYAGASFCLAALSMGLDERFDITLLEQAESPGPVGAGILLQPSGQFVLKKLGLFGDEIRSGLHLFKRFKARDGLEKYFLDLSVCSHEYQSYGAHRGAIYSVLLQALKTASESGRVRLSFGEQVDRVCRTQQAWDLAAGDQELGRFDLVVVADGSRSVNRELLGFSCLQRSYQIGAMWFVGKSDEPQGELLQSCHGTSRLVGLLPTDQSGHVSFFFSCSTEEHQGYLERPFSSFVKKAGEIAPECLSLLEQSNGFKDLIHTRYLHGWMPTWIKPGAVVIGDAAHPMSPHLGQGVNLALMDGYSLAKSLALGNIPESLCRYQSKRRGQVAINSWLSLVLTPFFQSTPDLGQGHLRNLGVRLFSSWPWMRGQMQGAIWGRKHSVWGLSSDFEEMC